jgi:hypothetical protein
MSSSARHQELSSSTSSSSSTTTRASSSSSSSSSTKWLPRWFNFTNNKMKYKSKYLYYGVPVIGCLILIFLQGITFVQVNTNAINDVDYIDALPIIIKTISSETLPNGDTVTTTTTSTTTTAIINDNDNEIYDNNNNNNDDDDDYGRPIELLLTLDEGIWIRDRTKQFDIWFQESKNITILRNKHKKMTEKVLKLNSDSELPGPILDFLIVGSAKTGTTTLMDNLSRIAPMPSAKDVCFSPENILSIVYNDWPNRYMNNVSKIIIPSLISELNNVKNDSITTSNNNTQQNEQQHEIHLKGSKCPSLFGLPMLKRYSQSLPKTKFIIGIRHPITWFQSFWKMQGAQGPYERTQICPCPPHENPKQNNMFKNESVIYDSLTRRCTIIPEDNDKSNTTSIVVGCKNECGYKLFCTARARFHLSLARLGKTMLTSYEERSLLAPNDPDGGLTTNGLISWNVTNDIFVYDQTQLNEDYLWDGLASFLKLSKIPHAKKQLSKGRNKINLDICDPMYDSFRAIMMKSSYEMSLWLEQYFLPVALNPNRTDVTIVNGPNNNEFLDIIQSYKLDPCERLILVRNGNEDEHNNSTSTTATMNNVEYVLHPSFNTSIIPPPPNRKKYDYNIRTESDDDPSNNKKEKRKKEKDTKKDAKKEKEEKRARKQQGSTIKKK